MGTFDEESFTTIPIELDNIEIRFPGETRNLEYTIDYLLIREITIFSS